jgi:hypothetical protein
MLWFKKYIDHYSNEHYQQCEELCRVKYVNENMINKLKDMEDRELIIASRLKEAHKYIKYLESKLFDVTLSSE